MDISAKKINVNDLKNNLLRSWVKYHMVLFYALLFAALLSGAYIWQISLAGSGWSEDRKQEYMKAQNNNVILKEKDLKNIIEEVKNRKSGTEEQFQPLKDTFK